MGAARGIAVRLKVHYWLLNSILVTQYSKSASFLGKFYRVFIAKQALLEWEIPKLERPLSGNTNNCHCEVFFAEACLLGSQSP